VAVEAGLGHMGIHRNLIHPKFGNFVLLGTVLIDCDAIDYDHPTSLLVRSAPSDRMALSTSHPASPTTIVNFSAAFPIGSSRWRTARTPSTTVGASVSRRRHRCGRAWALVPITNRPIAWPFARPART